MTTNSRRQATTFTPVEVLASIDRVFEHGVEKHGAFGYRTLDPSGAKGISHQVRKALGHMYKWDAVSRMDESGESHLAHAITRLIIALDMELRKDGPQRNQGTAEGVSQTSTVSDYIQKEVNKWKEETGRNR